jgi:hypothetical protein
MRRVDCDTLGEIAAPSCNLGRYGVFNLANLDTRLSHRLRSMVDSLLHDHGCLLSEFVVLKY